MRYVFNPTVSLSKIPSDTKDVHLTRPVKLIEIKKLIKKCMIESISMSKSCFDRLSTKTKKFLKQKNIDYSVEEKRGRALSLSMDEMLRVIELRKDYQTLREIERLTNVPKSTVHYLVKYANRSKIKKDGEVIYLK